mmetsp:Transcript_56895/g.133411  ORF Transcript_56895/g.133411 Transcript_56895/m.133411 type:complete len:210 (+) Transcript_56895:1725-2354(+)
MQMLRCFPEPFFRRRRQIEGHQPPHKIVVVMHHLLCLEPTVLVLPKKRRHRENNFLKQRRRLCEPANFRKITFGQSFQTRVRTLDERRRLFCDLKVRLAEPSELHVRLDRQELARRTQTAVEHHAERCQRLVAVRSARRHQHAGQHACCHLTQRQLLQQKGFLFHISGQRHPLLPQHRMQTGRHESQPLDPITAGDILCQSTYLLNRFL